MEDVSHSNYSNQTVEKKNENNDKSDNSTTISNLTEITPDDNELKKEKQEQEEKIKKDKEKNNNQNLNLNEAFSLDKYKKAPMVALENIGNTSYMNCVIQCLSNIRPIVSYYLKNLNEFKYHIQDMPLTYGLSRIIFHLYPYPQDSLKKSFSLSGFYKAFVDINPSFSGKKSKNAIDFLIYLLEAIHNEDKNFSFHNNKNESINNNNTIFKDYIKYLNENERSCIFNNFCWINQKTKKCLECKNESTNYQNFFTFDLNFKKVFKDILFINKKNEISVMDCLEYFLKKKNIKMYCNNCHKINKLCENNSIYFNSNVLIFLFRGYDDKELKENLSKNINFKYDAQINLTKYIKEDNTYKTYSLCGIIVFDFEHFDSEDLKYTAYCLNPIDNYWYVYSENSVEKIKIDEFLTTKYRMYPVILFYKHNE